MKLTKYTHSCFILEQATQTLIVDPGNWSTDIEIPANVVAVLFTHQHADHFDLPLLQKIIQENPAATIIAPSAMVSELSEFSFKGVNAGDTLTIGPFELRFYGGEHAIIHPSMKSVVNLGVLINDSLYYPGDSFVLPDKPVTTLALPVVAPWLKISESIDFMTELHPKLAFPMHDHIASDEGKALVDHILTGFAETCGTTYQRITDPIEIA